VTVVDQALVVMDRAKQEIFTLRERVDSLESELLAISAFAVGNGDICEVIARRARRAVNPETIERI
jgi:hypothetical protein